MSDQSAESGRVFVSHEVSFHLAPAERFVVPRRQSRGYVSVGYITVHLNPDQRVWITASGSVCKKDGTPSAVTSMNESIDLPDEAYWVERARAELNDGQAARQEWLRNHPASNMPTTTGPDLTDGSGALPPSPPERRVTPDPRGPGEAHISA